MILTNPRGLPATTRIGARATLDELLRRTAQRQPDAVALVDPPNRDSFTGGRPRSLTYAQADRMVSAIAGRLRRMGLYTDAVVGIQVANTVESVLTLLGVLRAGLIAMPLPLLWRRAEAVAALSRVGVHALVVSGRIGELDHYDLAMQIAAEIFPVRYVCGFGGDAPDGVISFDDLYDANILDPLPSLDAERAGDPGNHVAVHHLGRLAGRPRSGGAHSLRADRGRARDGARRQAAAGRGDAVAAGDVVVCESRHCDDALAAAGRHAHAASSVRH
jgi:hypothetical protein